MKKSVFVLIVLLCFFLIACNKVRDDEEMNSISNDNKINVESEQSLDRNNQAQEMNNDVNTRNVEMNDDILVNEIIDCNDIEKIVISLNLYSSINIYVEQKEEIELIIDILNSDKKQIFSEVEFSIYDINCFVDIIYKEKTISIKILSVNDIYYFINDDIYICTKSNHELLANFIIQKYNESIPETNFQFIKKVK